MNDEKKFVEAPEWKKVEKFTTIISNILSNNKLTYIEKYNIITLVKSVIDREFNMVGVLTYLENIARQEEITQQEGTSHIYR